MLSFSDLIITKNAEGIPTALGYPINSILLQQNKPLFMGGGSGTKCQTNNSSLFMNPERLAVPSGLVCMTQTVCRKADEIGANEIGADEIGADAIGADAMDYGANAMGADEMGANAMGADEYGSQSQIIPEDLYEQLLALAETKPPKKLSRRKQPVHKVAKNNGAKNKTKKKK